MRAALQSGVDVNSKDPDNEMTALMGAVKWNQPAVVSLLLVQEDIDVNSVYEDGGMGWDNGKTALHFAAGDDRISECLAMLLSRPDLATLNQKDKYGRTPLFVAVSARPRRPKGGSGKGALRCVQLLLCDKRTDPNIKDLEPDGYESIIWEGDSPLMFAVKWNLVDCVKLLLADPRVDLSEREER